MSKIMYSLDDNCEVEVSGYIESNGEEYALCYFGKNDKGLCRIVSRSINRLVELEPEELEITEESLEWIDVE